MDRGRVQLHRLSDYFGTGERLFEHFQLSTRRASVRRIGHGMLQPTERTGSTHRSNASLQSSSFERHAAQRQRLRGTGSHNVSRCSANEALFLRGRLSLTLPPTTSRDDFAIRLAVGLKIKTSRHILILTSATLCDLVRQCATPNLSATSPWPACDSESAFLVFGPFPLASDDRTFAHISGIIADCGPRCSCCQQPQGHIDSWGWHLSSRHRGVEMVRCACELL